MKTSPCRHGIWYEVAPLALKLPPSQKALGNRRFGITRKGSSERLSFVRYDIPQNPPIPFLTPFVYFVNPFPGPLLPMRNLLLTAAALFIALTPLARGHDARSAEEMAQAAKNFLADLTPEQKEKVQFQFTDDERRNWHFIPRARKGLPVKEMTQPQRLLSQALLASGLSSRGYEKAVTIMSLEEVLAELEKGKTGTPLRDPENYYFSIFGDPTAKGPWGWRVEGHHLSLNFANAGDEVISMTPSFFGSNPGEVREGPRAGLRLLAPEEDLARQLVKSLSDDQRKVAIIMAEAPKDIINVPGRNERTNPDGLAQDKMTPEQTATLVSLIKTYLGRHRVDLAHDDWEKIEKTGLDKIHFAWAGGTEPGQPHYYRVQGPGFVLEYDNTQNNANHIHSVWRDFNNDFGGDVLKAHYEEAHSAGTGS